MWRSLPDVRDTGGGVVCFDADGTLWMEDVQEAVLRSFIQERRLLGVDYGTDVFFAEYQSFMMTDPPAGIARAMTLLAGLDADEVDRAARAVVEHVIAPTVHPGMKSLVAAAQGRGFETWVVTGSGARFVRLAAPLVGIAPERVVGLEIAVDADGRFTERVVGPVPYGPGKVACIDGVIGRRPWLALGNGPGDHEMLASAVGLAVVVNPDRVYAQRVRRLGWPIVRLRRRTVLPG